MGSFLHFILIFLASAAVYGQTQLFQFNDQLEYNQWNAVSTAVPASFAYSLADQAVHYSCATMNQDHLLSTQLLNKQLPFQVLGDFKVSFKVRKQLASSSNSYFPLLLTNQIQGPPNEHPWRMGPTNPPSLGQQQSIPLLGVIFTHDQIGFVYRQNNSSSAIINYIANFDLPSNTDLWIELIRSCDYGFRLSVFDVATMDNTPLATETTNLVNISVPLNTLYIANCNGNGEWTEHDDLLDDYRVELLPETIITFDHTLLPFDCFNPGKLTINSVSGGIPPYTFSFNGNSTSSNEFYFDEPGDLNVTVIDLSGCSSSMVIENNFTGGKGNVHFPNVFTPNVDDKNEHWYPTGNCIKNYTCTILDRWGNQIITLTDPKQTWDGTYRSKDCSEGVYFYAVTIEYYSGDKEQHHGSISLNR